MPGLLTRAQDYRNGLLEERIREEKVLNSAFWYYVYHNETASYEHIMVSFGWILPNYIYGRKEEEEATLLLYFPPLIGALE